MIAGKREIKSDEIVVYAADAASCKQANFHAAAPVESHYIEIEAQVSKHLLDSSASVADSIWRNKATMTRKLT